MDKATLKALAFVLAFEGRGRQGCPAITANKELGPVAVMDLGKAGLLASRERWGRPFYYLTPEGRRVLGT